MKASLPFLRKEKVRPKELEWEAWLALYFPLFWISFSFWATFSPVYKEKKSQKKKPYSPLNRLSSASAMRDSAFVGARVPERTWASTDSRAAETVGSWRNRFMR